MKKSIKESVNCLVCNNKSIIYDVVDFNKSCEEYRGKYLDLSGIPIYYYLCENCNFCFAPEFQKWTFKDFQENIYNDSYIDVDTDFVEIRPRENAELVNNTFYKNKQSIKHLDYGGGNKKLSNFLCDKDWDSSSYDPFVDVNTKINTLGKFDLITAFEVFEHVSNIDELMQNLSTLIKDNGIIAFGTALSDTEIKKNKRLTWWYASPRNGHISLFSTKSLTILAKKYNFKFKTMQNFHVFYKNVPFWFEPLQYSNNYDFSLNLNQIHLQIENLANKKIVLYGAGKTATLVLDFLDKSNIVSIVDKIKTPSSLLTLDYDFIIITVLDRESNIINYLSTELNISLKKIIPLNLNNKDSELDFSKKISYFYNFIENLNYNKIVLYGAGKISALILKMYPHNIIAIVDEKPEKAFIKDFQIDYPKELAKKEYDVIIITVLGREQLIIKDLEEKYNIPSGKIIPFRIE